MYTRRDCCAWTMYGHSYEDEDALGGCTSCIGIELLYTIRLLKVVKYTVTMTDT